MGFASEIETMLTPDDCGTPSTITRPRRLLNRTLSSDNGVINKCFSIDKSNRRGKAMSKDKSIAANQGIDLDFKLAARK